MGNSLQDQLLKAGMVDKNKAKKLKKTKHKQKVGAPKGSLSEAELAKQRAEKAKQEKAERDRQLNQQRHQEAQQKAIHAQIRQLIETNRLTDTDGEAAYNFTHNKKIKRLYITEALINDLSRGNLAIATLDEQYQLIPKGVAEKISQRDESYICMLNTQQEESDEDDPYADYKIPDDLMW